MVGLMCPADWCDYMTEDCTADQIIDLLKLHIDFDHPEEVPSLSSRGIDTPKLKMGVSQDEFNFSKVN